MNKTIFTGRLVKDPDIRFSGENNDLKTARYILAVDRNIKRDPNNPEQQTADFINCVCFGKTADFVDTYLRKGTKILIEGHIQTGKYTNKDGQTIYTTDNVVERHEFCESKSSSNQGSTSTQPQQTASAPAASAPQPAQAAPAQQQADMGFINIPDGIAAELPFN